MKETWWLWLILIGFGSLMSFLVSQVFWVTLPISIVTFFWFGFVRYDADGEFKGS